jgi:hypothetical protein
MQDTPTLDPQKERKTRAGRAYADLPHWVARISMPIVLRCGFFIIFGLGYTGRGRFVGT